MGPLLAQLVQEPIPDTGVQIMSDEETVMENEASELDATAMHGDSHPGVPSGFGCPDSR